MTRARKPEQFQGFRLDRSVAGLGLVLSAVLILLLPARAQAQAQARDLTVLPLIGSGDARTLAPNLTGMLFAELRRYEGLELRIRQPAQPLTGKCITSPECLTRLGQELGAQQLLVGVAIPKNQRTSLTLLLFNVTNGTPTRSSSLELIGAQEGFQAQLAPVIGELAGAAGGNLPVLERPSDPGAAPRSLDQLIEALPVQTQQPTHARVEEPAPVLEAEDLRQKKKEEADRLRALEAAAREESRERDRLQAMSGQERAREQKAEQRQVEFQQKHRQWEARQEARAQARRRKLQEARREENMQRQRARLEPLPDIDADTPLPLDRSLSGRIETWWARVSEPALPEGDREKAQNLATSERKEAVPGPSTPALASDSGASSSSPARPEKSSPSAGPQAAQRPSDTPSRPGHPAGNSLHASSSTPAGSEVAGLTSSGPKRLSLLENEGPWQLGGGASVVGLLGLGMGGPQLEVAFEPLRRLWIEGGVLWLNGADPTDSSWYFVYAARVGVVFRPGTGRLHPFGGLDLTTLFFGPGAIALGGTARGGLDIMLSAGVGLRLEIAVGALSSERFSSDAYGYPSTLQSVAQAGLSVRYRFE